MATCKHSLIKHPKGGHWYTRIQRGGIVKYFPFGTSRRQAEQDLQDLERRIARGEVSFAEQETTQTLLSNGKTDVRIEELAVKHLEWVKNNRTLGTFEMRQHYVLRFLDYIGTRMVSQIGLPDFDGFRSSEIRKNPNMKNPASEALRHIRTMFHWGEDNGICDMPVRKFPEIRFEPPQTKTLTQEDLATLLTKAPADFSAMIRFGIMTGLRPQEVRGLRKEHLHPGSDGGFYLMIEKHKTARHSSSPKPRSVPLVEDAQDIWNRCIQSHPKSPYIFLNDDGEPYIARTYRQRFRRLCKRAGVREAPPYSLRHCFGTALGAAGVNQSVISQLMGHTKLQTTARYIGCNDEAHKKATGIIEQKLRDAMSKMVKIEAVSAGSDAETGKNLSPDLSPVKTEMMSEKQGIPRDH